MPQWLAQDQQLAQQQQRQEEQQRVDNAIRLQQDVGRRARERQNHPERQNINRTINTTQQQLQGTLYSLENLNTRKLDAAMMELRIKELRLSYDLQRPLMRYRNLLSRARTKHGEAIERWRRKIIDQTLISMRKDPALGGMPREAVYAIQDTPLPTPREFGETMCLCLILTYHSNIPPPLFHSLHPPSLPPISPSLSLPSLPPAPPLPLLGLNEEEVIVMELFDRLPQPPNIFEKVKMERELVQVRKEQKELTTQHNRHHQTVLR